MAFDEKLHGIPDPDEDARRNSHGSDDNANPYMKALGPESGSSNVLARKYST